VTASETTAERHRDLDRFLTFLDAVVAIAITLLVLPLVEITGEVREATVSEVLVDHQAEIWAFLLSFVVIARLWFAQHGSVSPLVLLHGRIARLLTAWMLTIVFLPFPTALVAQAPNAALTKLLYIGTITLAGVLLLAVDLTAIRHPELSDGRRLPGPEGAAATVVLLLAALVITLALPATSYFPMLLLLLTDPLVRAWRRVRGRGPEHPAVGG
jgi:uncharacterized membrane protein